MPEPDLIDLFVRPLHARGLRYFIAGSFGSMFYSEPRLTMDIDLAVALENDQLSVLAQIFQEPDYYCPPAEILALENDRECRGHFNVIHIPSGLKADFYPSHKDPFFLQAWRNRREIVLGSGSVNYAPPEYVILWKVVYFAEGGGDKHVRDIRRMWDISKDEIDHDALQAELGKRRLWETFQRILATE